MYLPMYFQSLALNITDWKGKCIEINVVNVWLFPSLLWPIYSYEQTIKSTKLIMKSSSAEYNVGTSETN